MDVVLARTFLEIASSGSFIAAAERLNLTQTAVSARIRVLEEQLGRRLFVRNKAGARLTPAGERLVRHATTLIQVWEQARQDVALPPGREQGISLGCEPSLWQPLFADWLVWLHDECPDVALRAEIDMPARLVDRVLEGSLDLALVYNPPQRPNLVAEPVAAEKLVMVTTAADGALHRDRYVYVDWGPRFAVDHRAAYPDLVHPVTSIGFGPLALNYILAVGGCGYFRISTVQPYLDDGRVRRVADAPEFSHSVHVVHAQRDDGALMNRVRNGLRAVAGRKIPVPKAAG
jgi:DNA-binding transcriptional LysR family regulator